MKDLSPVYSLKSHLSEMLENMKMPFNKKITLAITLGVFTTLSPFV